ncbi:MAG: hypothetical protein V4676_11165 [Bacteroidota bacterium]
MKKTFFLLTLVFAIGATSVSAQGGGGNADPAAMLQRMKERVKPQLIEKTKITDAEADKVIDAQFAWQRGSRDVRMDEALTEEQKKTRTAELDTKRNAAFAAIPLTGDQLKSVNEFFEEMRKQQAERRKNGGN